MRVVVQRVSEASVEVDSEVIGEIKHGLLILLGIEDIDTEDDAQWLANKIINQRIFSDENDKMNNSLIDANGEVLIISQFTLHAQTKKGNRPSFIKAARPEKAIPLYEYFISQMQTIIGKSNVATGEFGADMKVRLLNDGPVTITMDTQNKE